MGWSARWHLLGGWALALCLVVGRAGAAPGDERPGPNLALGAPYTLDPPPNYVHCTDPEDAVQLTDGRVTNDYFWTQKSTVGWHNTKQPIIVIDLGQPQAIRGASFRTAAGVAGVIWPAGLEMFVSDDQAVWYPLGDLTRLDYQRSQYTPEAYEIYRYWTGALQTWGRYVAFVALPGGSSVFCDEIEVYGGDPAWLNTPRPGHTVTDLRTVRGQGFFARDMQLLFNTVSERIAALAADEQPAARALLEQARAALPGFTAPGTGRAVFPLGEPDRLAFAANAAVLRARGAAPLTVWPGHRWEPLRQLDEPPLTPPAVALDFRLMGREHRAGVVNLTNATAGPLTLEVSVEGLPAGAVTVRQALWTPVRGAAPMASALPALEGPLTLTPGLNQQLWIAVDAGQLPPGEHTGTLRLAGGPDGEVAVPLTLHVSALALPAELTLTLGGWDYTDAPRAAVTAANIDELAAFLRSYGINAPWATRAVLPFGTHDATGAMTAPPDTAPLDTWLARWPGARYYCVALGFHNNLTDDPVATRRAQDWIRFWCDALRARQIDPAKLVLMIADETRNAGMDAAIVSWAKALKAVEPEVLIYNDPIWTDPRDASPEMYAWTDMLCPNRNRWQALPEAYEAVYTPLRTGQHPLTKAPREFVFYSCSGPVRTLDPYGYHLLPAWQAFQVGATGSMFWAFCDAGGGSAWNEYATGGYVYSPQMIGPEGLETAKAMEAIRESAEDYEYLVMLRDAVNAAQAAGRRDTAATTAAQLLQTVVDEVLEGMGPDTIRWTADVDRSRADQARLRILAALEALAG